MALIQCNNGHFYQADQHTDCPHCGQGNTTTVGEGGLAGHPMHTMPEPGVFNGGGNIARDAGATVGLFRKKTGMDPVVGWLICTAGADKGRDYRLRMDRNSIGRSPDMDVCINGDDTISRERHAYVSFNPRKNIFTVSPGEGRGLIYLNDEEVSGAMPLEAYDRIELGDATLLFIPFCGEKFQWIQE